MPYFPALHDIFSSDRISLNVQSLDKSSLFSELIELIARSHPLDSCAALTAVMNREALMSTGIYEHVAIPHGKCDTVTKVIGAIGISRSGIQYDSFDGKPVKIVFLLLSPKSHPEIHLAVLKKLAALVGMPGFISSLVDSKNVDDVYETIKRFELNL